MTITTRTAQYGRALKASLAVNGTDLNYEAEVASIAVMDGDKILMGRRRDSGKWTLPGGHLEAGEDPLEGALRELAEETGIHAHSLNHLGSQGVISETGKVLMIHAYHLTAAPKTHTKNDPDQEVLRWRWIDVSRGLPEHIASNLHSKRNITLMLLDIYRSFGPGLYVEDTIIKSRPHKYLRKYKGRNGEWVYIYHEAGAHGRRIHQDTYHEIKRLAELGHEDSRTLHDTLEEHSEEKLRDLRRLADLGHEPTKEHLKSLGIDRAKERKEEEAEEAERQLLRSSSLTEHLNDEDEREVNKIMLDEIKRQIDHLSASQHQGTELARALRASGLTVAILSQGEAAPYKGFMASRSVGGKVEALHESLKKLDRAFKGLRSARTEINTAGGYGSYIYGEVIKKLKAEAYLPSQMPAERGPFPYQELHPHAQGLTQRRHAERRDRALREERERRERAEREERERVEREARRVREEAERREREAAEARELHEYLPKADEMASHFNMTLSQTDKLKLAKGIRKFFGKRFSMNKFAEYLNPDPRSTSVIKVGESFLHDMMSGGRNINFSFAIREKDTGVTITHASRGVSVSENGAIHWSNGCFGRPSNAMLKKHKGIGKGVYRGVESFLLEVTQDLPQEAKDECKISMSAANSGFGDSYKGALLWAKHCFGFSGSASSWQQGFSNQIEWAMGADPSLREVLTPIKASLSSKQHPHEFVKLNVPLTKEQAERLFPLDFDFKEQFKMKPTVDIGELLLIRSQMGFSGVSYFNRTTGPHGDLNRKRAVYYRREGSTNEAPQQSASAPQQSTSARVTKLLSKTPAGKSVVLTEKRVQQLSSWTKAEVSEFYRLARLTPKAKRRVREILEGMAS